MTEPQKPFACTFPDCGMSFTNEDHLHVHTKKHDMQLQFGPEQKAAFVADQTPTPTRFIRNCEEVGLFQDLQNVTVNPFDEGFKRAMETKQGILSLETLSSADDVLHTPQMVFPLMEGDSALFSATNNQRNITISRSSSDESGTIKEYGTTTISKLTNEVTTISRIVGNRDLIDKTSTEDVSIVTNTDIVHNKDNIETVSYKNNVIKIHSNVEIRKDSVNIENKAPVLIFTDTVTKDAVKDVLLADTNKLQVPEKLPPIMSQKSLDFVVDSLTSELDEVDKDKPIIKSNVTINTKTDDAKVTEAKIPKTPKVVKRYIRRNIEPVRVTASRNELNEKAAKKIRIEPKSHNEEYEVIIKLPNGKHVIMKAVDEATPDPKEILKRNLANKIIRQQSQTNPVTLHHNVLHIPGGGTLIPVTFLNDAGNVTSIPVTNLSNVTIPVTQLNHKVPISANPTNIKNLANEPNLIKVVKFTNKIIPVTNSNISKSFPKVKVSRAFQLDDNGKRTGSNKKIPPKTNNNIANKIEREENVRISEEPIVINEEPVIIHEDLKNNMEDDIEIEIDSPDSAKRTKIELQSRCAASKRYRSRVRETLKKQSDEIKQLRESNQSLAAERALLKLLIVEHMKRCPNSEDFQISCHAKTLQNINMNGF